VKKPLISVSNFSPWAASQKIGCFAAGADIGVGPLEGMYRPEQSQDLIVRTVNKG
jgi:hypothetical protein